MKLEPTGIDAGPLVAMAMIQCGLQGVLIPLLVAFLNSKRSDSKWLKGYVICLYLLGTTKTGIHILQGFDALNQIPPRPITAPAIPFLTAVLGAAVQGFFIFRCWRIFQQRWVPIIPYVALWVCSTVLGIKGVVDQSQLTFTLWLSGSFLLDLSTTVTTIIYVYQWRKDLRKHDGVFGSIWQIIWVSAAPPLILAAVPVLDICITKGQSELLIFFCVGLAGKFFALSLMLTLLGRGYVNKRLQQTAELAHSSTLTSDVAMQTSAPTFARGESSAYEFDVRNSPATPQVFTIAKKLGQSTSSHEEGYTHHRSPTSKLGDPEDSLSAD